MGMPINSFNVLNVLANRGEQYEMEAVRKALEPFNCFAFILHDPEKDWEFHQYLSRQFDRLDYITGDNLLFFALVDPPEDWLRHGRSRAYYRELTFFSEQMLEANNYPKTVDPSISAYTLARTLGINYRDLPCIIITSDFKRPEYLWVRTDQQKLYHQLEELGYEATRRSYYSYPYKKLDESLASTLASPLSVMVPSGDYKYPRAEQQSKKIIKDLYQVLEDLRASGGNENQYFDIAEKLGLLLGLANRKNIDQIEEIRNKVLPISKQYLDQDSEIILRTGIRVFNYLNEDVEHTDPTNTTPQDYSPAIISLAKVFEREINLSIVHFLRDYLKIKLPTFYDAYQPGLDKNPNINRAYFNSGDGKEWTPPALGQSKQAFKVIFGKNILPPNWTQKDCEDLYEQWHLIHQSRNPAAHDKVSNRESLNVVHNALVQLNASDYFQKFYRLKCTYRGEPISDER